MPITHVLFIVMAIFIFAMTLVYLVTNIISAGKKAKYISTPKVLKSEELLKQASQQMSNMNKSMISADEAAANLSKAGSKMGQKFNYNEAARSRLMTKGKTQVWKYQKQLKNAELTVFYNMSNMYFDISITSEKHSLDHVKIGDLVIISNDHTNSLDRFAADISCFNRTNLFSTYLLESSKALFKLEIQLHHNAFDVKVLDKGRTIQITSKKENK